MALWKYIRELAVDFVFFACFLLVLSAMRLLEHRLPLHGTILGLKLEMVTDTGSLLVVFGWLRRSAREAIFGKHDEAANDDDDGDES